MSIESAMDCLQTKYALVIELVAKKERKRKKFGKPAKPGQNKKLILEILRDSKKPLRAFELVKAMGPKTSDSSIRQLLTKMLVDGSLTKDKNNAYARKGERKVVRRKLEERK